MDTLEPFPLEDAWIQMWGNAQLSPDCVYVHTKEDYQGFMSQNQKWHFNKELNCYLDQSENCTYHIEDETFQSFSIKKKISVGSTLRAMSSIGLPIQKEYINAS